MRPEEQERADFQVMVSKVITRFNEIEFQLNAVLIRGLELPKHKQKFAFSVLFNNAILPFAQKVKLLLNLSSEMKWPTLDSGSFHRLMQIRNQFAYCPPSEWIKLTI